MSSNQKIFWFDTETSGLDAEHCDILRLAYIIEINGVEEEKGIISMRPHQDATVNKEALEINALSEKDVWMSPPQHIGLQKLVVTMKKYINHFDSLDKFIQAGYNTGFDDKFLRKAFQKIGDRYYGSWFFWPKLDVQYEVARWLLNSGERLENYQLGTVCKHFNIPIKPHIAMSDIEATKRLYQTLSLLKIESLANV